MNYVGSVPIHMAELFDDDYPVLVLPEDALGYLVNSSEDAIKFIRRFAVQQIEYIYCMTLGADRGIINVRIVAIGAWARATASVRDIVRTALSDSARFIVFVHNHPTGNITPSEADRQFACDLKKYGEIVGISLLDSLIVYGDRWQSFNPDSVEEQSYTAHRRALCIIFESMTEFGRVFKSVGLLSVSMMVALMYVVIASGQPFSSLNALFFLIFVYPAAWVIETVGSVGSSYMEDAS